VAEDYSSLESLAKKAISEKQQFVRLVLTKEELLEMFKVLLVNPNISTTNTRSILLMTRSQTTHPLLYTDAVL
jgi:threonyl-tRNA synthetase